MICRYSTVEEFGQSKSVYCLSWLWRSCFFQHCLIKATYGARVRIASLKKFHEKIDPSGKAQKGASSFSGVSLNLLLRIHLKRSSVSLHFKDFPVLSEKGNSSVVLLAEELWGIKAPTSALSSVRWPFSVTNRACIGQADESVPACGLCHRNKKKQ